MSRIRIFSLIHWLYTRSYGLRHYGTRPSDNPTNNSVKNFQLSHPNDSTLLTIHHWFNVLQLLVVLLLSLHNSTMASFDDTAGVGEVDLWKMSKQTIKVPLAILAVRSKHVSFGKILVPTGWCSRVRGRYVFLRLTCEPSLSLQEI